MSDTLTPAKIAELREMIEREVSGSAEYFALREVARNLLKAAEERATLRAERDTALAENARLKAKLDFLEAKGITVGEMQSSDRPEPYLAYVIRPNSELDDTDTISKLTDAEIENARLRDLLARVQVEDRWQPIETAPKDGTRVMLWHALWTNAEAAYAVNSPNVGIIWKLVGCDYLVGIPPTHWRPLPMTPAEEAELDALRKAVAIAIPAEMRTRDVCGVLDGMIESADYSATPMLVDAVRDAGGTEDHALAVVRSLIYGVQKADAPKLWYADYLEERGEVERAEFIRVQCELARIGSPKCNQPEKCYYANACEHGCGGARRDELIHRERELLKTNAHRWWDDQNRDWLVIRVDDDCEICFGQEIPGNGRTLLRHGKTVRGFIASITLSWADFLRHHAALIWSPRQTVECDNCEGAGEFTRENSDPPYGPCPDCGGRMWSGPYLDPDDHGWDKGTGRIPRPFVNTAQPIETVRLTTWPVNIRNENQVWVAEYRFDRVKCGTCDGDPGLDWDGSPRFCRECCGRHLNLWRCDAWPGVEFVMPE